MEVEDAEIYDLDSSKSEVNEPYILLDDHGHFINRNNSNYPSDDEDYVDIEDSSDMFNENVRSLRNWESLEETRLKSQNHKICKSSISSTYKSNHHQYICPFCLEQFKHKESLTSHEFFHTGQLPFKCHVCDQAFRKSKLLILHSVLHENFHVSDSSEQMNKE